VDGSAIVFIETPARIICSCSGSKRLSHKERLAIAGGHEAIAESVAFVADIPDQLLLAVVGVNGDGFMFQNYGVRFNIRKGILWGGIPRVSIDVKVILIRKALLHHLSVSSRLFFFPLNLKLVLNELHSIIQVDITLDV